MHFRNSLILFFILTVKSTFPQYQGPVPEISGGYGSEGQYEVSLNVTSSPLWPATNISVYSPIGSELPAPVIFFAHGFGANYAFLYQNLLYHFASRGFAVVFSPYPGMSVALLTPETVLERYEVLWQGFKKAVHEFPGLIDSTRVGFIGHSFGGGAVPSMTKRAINSGWGNNGCFMMPLAPWFFYDITEEELQNIAPQTKLLMQVYENDVVNDHRLAIDVFNHILIDNDGKDFVEIFSDNIGGYFYNADHGLPETFSVYNALDCYAVFRLADALADYALKGNQEAKNVALGNGNPEQVNMAPLKPLSVSDNPVPSKPAANYYYRCDNFLNPRSAFCGGLGIDNPDFGDNEILISPNPAKDFIYVRLQTNFTTGFVVQISDVSGKSVICRSIEARQAFGQDVSDLKKGIYFIKIQSSEKVAVSKFVVGNE